MYGGPNGLLQVADHPLHDVIMLTWSDGRDGHAHCIHVSCKRRDPSFIVAGEAGDLDTAGSDGAEHPPDALSQDWRCEILHASNEDNTKRMCDGNQEWLLIDKHDITMHVLLIKITVTFKITVTL